MTLYDHMTLYNKNDLVERIQLLYKEALPMKMGMRDGSPMACWSPTKINSSKDEHNI